MTRLARKLEGLLIEITFAEEREFTSARQALKRFTHKQEDTLIAITFAEAGEIETAVSYVNKDGEAPRSRRTRYPTRRFTKICAGRA